MNEAVNSPLPFFRFNDLPTDFDSPFVAIVRSSDEMEGLLAADFPHIQWARIENLLSDPKIWRMATRASNSVAFDVLYGGSDTVSSIYHLVDVAKVRNVRLTLPVQKGAASAFKLATAIHLPVKLLLKQPSSDAIGDLEKIITSFIGDSSVESPVEPLQGFLEQALGRGGETSVWSLLEQNPELYRDIESLPEEDSSFVSTYFDTLLDKGAECKSCPHREMCRGYFKYPDESFDCTAIIEQFDRLSTVAIEVLAHLDEYKKINPVGK